MIGVATSVAEVNLSVTGHVLSLVAGEIAKTAMAGGAVRSEEIAKDGSHEA